LHPGGYPNFHRDFLKGKVVMVGCPKFDEVQVYIQKFADIFETAGIRGFIASYVLKGKKTAIVETGPTSSIPKPSAQAWD
jgi:hypothetical protein